MRKFEWGRKSRKIQPKSKENATIIRALNNYGRVPKTYELLNEIDRLNNIVNEYEKVIERLRMRVNMLRKDIDSFIQDNKRNN